MIKKRKRQSDEGGEQELRRFKRLRKMFRGKQGTWVARAGEEPLGKGWRRKQHLIKALGTVMDSRFTSISRVRFSVWRFRE